MRPNIETVTESSARPSAPRVRGTKPAWLVVVLCWSIVVLDGYGLIVFGTTLPTIMQEWPDLTPSTAGMMSSLVFVGSLLGALGAGDVADRIGRRKTILGATLVFTTFTVLIYFAPNMYVFGAFRFIAGLGLGGLVPSANAITAEFVPVRQRSTISTIMMSGVPIGGSIAALLGLVMLPDPGWREMYLVATAGFVLLAIAFFVLPESPAWLRAHGQQEQAERVAREWGVAHALEDDAATAKAKADAAAKAAFAEAKEDQVQFSASRNLRPEPQGMGALFTRGWALPTAMFGFASIFTLFTWYGLGTWLPKLMAQDAHYSELMFNPLVFMLSLNIGAVIGSIATAWAGVKFGPLRSAVAAALMASAGLGSLLTFPDSALLVNAALVLAGIGTHGTQCLVLAAIASHYPPELRGKALGFGSGMGRIGAIVAPILGGFLVGIAASLNNPSAGTMWNFFMFSAGAALAAGTLALTNAIARPAKNADSSPVIGH